MTMTVVVPARMVENRVQTNAFERHAFTDGDFGLPADIAEPAGALVILDAGFGNQNRTFVALVIFDQNLVKRAIKLVTADDFVTVRIKPLVVKIIIQPDYVDIVTASAE